MKRRYSVGEALRRLGLTTVGGEVVARAVGEGCTDMGEAPAAVHAVKSLLLGNNAICRVEGLAAFASLERLSLANNLIAYLDDVSGLEAAERLTWLRLSGNDVCRLPGYRRFVCGLCPRLEELDGLGVSPRDRRAVHHGLWRDLAASLEACRLARASQGLAACHAALLGRPAPLQQPGAIVDVWRRSVVPEDTRAAQDLARQLYKSDVDDDAHFATTRDVLHRRLLSSLASIDTTPRRVLALPAPAPEETPALADLRRLSEALTNLQSGRAARARARARAARAVEASMASRARLDEATARHSAATDRLAAAAAAARATGGTASEETSARRYASSSSSSSDEEDVDWRAWSAASSSDDEAPQPSLLLPPQPTLLLEEEEEGSSEDDDRTLAAVGLTRLKACARRRRRRKRKNDWFSQVRALRAGVCAFAAAAREAKEQHTQAALDVARLRTAKLLHLWRRATRARRCARLVAKRAWRAWKAATKWDRDREALAIEHYFATLGARVCVAWRAAVTVKPRLALARRDPRPFALCLETRVHAAFRKWSRLLSPQRDDRGLLAQHAATAARLAKLRRQLGVLHKALEVRVEDVAPPDIESLALTAVDLHSDVATTLRSRVDLERIDAVTARTAVLRAQAADVRRSILTIEEDAETASLLAKLQEDHKTMSAELDADKRALDHVTRLVATTRRALST